MQGRDANFVIPDDGGAEPDVGLEKFLRDSFVSLLNNSTGSEIFPTLEMIIGTAELFVQDKIASTTCHLSPSEVFTLFIFCIDSNIQRLCVKAMRDWQDKPDDMEGANDVITEWRPLIHYTQRALMSLEPTESTVALYRSVYLNGDGTRLNRKDVLGILRKRPVGFTFTSMPYDEARSTFEWQDAMLVRAGVAVGGLLAVGVAAALARAVRK